VFLELFRVKPGELDEFTTQQLRNLADRADEIISAANRTAEQNG
jgi:F0F1-type ATP synthase membrane subunit b/b'